jgi:hypothetical protein
VHPRLGVDHQLLSPVEFLATLIPHILLRYQISSRLYGAISTRSRRRLGWIEHPPTRKPPPQYGPALEIHPPLPSSSTAPSPQTKPLRPGHPERDDQSDAPFAEERRRNWARLIARTYLCDPELCPSCGHRMLRAPSLVALSRRRDLIPRPRRHHREDPPPPRSSRRGPLRSGAPPGASRTGFEARATPPRRKPNRRVDLGLR